MNRRSVLKAGLAAGSLFLPVPYAWIWAQSEGTMKLLRAPKVALVLGNSKYKEAPLKNPANDAKAIADALKASGFEVTLKMDAGKEEMATAVQAYVQTLAAKKCVGLFYYAGHGLQLAWRNYMLPVDADIDTIGDIQKQAVELNAVLDGLTKAGNPMNVIIVDACRDNPFGNLKGVDHKGLSQMDAPQSTILAYATSPGNVASDGDGANGLYTENLLRELKVPEAKVEDVFKRVRLGVRVKSKGAQIPWESTSLEEDFWFIPPKELKKLSDAEKQRLLDEELKIWEGAKASKQAGRIEDYLRRYPNGEFCELAQLELDTVLSKQGEKRIEVQSQAGNPYTQGYARADTNYKVGDFYRYRYINLDTKAEREIDRRVTAVTDDDVIFNNGRLVLDRMGNNKKTADGLIFTDNQNMPLEFYVGKRWSTQYWAESTAGAKRLRNWVEIDYRITGRETVQVPAGVFDCFRVEGVGGNPTPRGRATISVVAWYAPEKIRRHVAHERIRKVPAGLLDPGVADRQELVAYQQT
ncbi:MAG: caspase family protein [Betaproteobacteria bacterium]|nr:caspase family protein [Betaproteobacteria bacterium]